MASGLPETSVAETLAEKIVALQAGALPAATVRKCENLLIDVVGLCVTARNEDYIRSALAGCDDDGPCTAVVLPNACHAASITNRSTQLLGQRRRKQIVATPNMKVLAGYLFVEFDQQKQRSADCRIGSQGDQFNGIRRKALVCQVLAEREVILRQNGVWYVGRKLTSFRQLQRSGQVAFRQSSAPKAAFLWAQLQWPIRFGALTDNIVLSTQMNNVRQISAFERFQRQSELAHVVQRELMSIRDSCSSCFSR